VDWAPPPLRHVPPDRRRRPRVVAARPLRLHELPGRGLGLPRQRRDHLPRQRVLKQGGHPTCPIDTDGEIVCWGCRGIFDFGQRDGDDGLGPSARAHHRGGPTHRAEGTPCSSDPGSRPPLPAAAVWSRSGSACGRMAHPQEEPCAI
jgi:hypothetical protein